MVVPFLKGKSIDLRPLQFEDARGPYVEWFNDPEVCAGNSHHLFPYTGKDAERFIQEIQQSETDLVLAIVHKEDGRHIGNIAIKKIDYIVRMGEFAIVVGDKTTWGKGFSREASRLLLNHAFFSLNLNRISCGTYENNSAMQKLATFLGMKKEGRRREAGYKNHGFLDVIEYGLLRGEYINRFGDPQ